MEASKQQGPALYTAGDILTLARVSKSHLYALVARGQFPEPAVRCGPRFTRWAARDVDEWLADPAGWMSSRAPAVGIAERNASSSQPVA